MQNQHVLLQALGLDGRDDHLRELLQESFNPMFFGDKGILGAASEEASVFSDFSEVPPSPTLNGGSNLILSYKSLLYKADDLEDVYRQMDFLNTTLVPGGRAQLVLIGEVDKTNLNKSSGYDDVVNAMRSNRFMRIRDNDFVGIFNMNQILEEFPFLDINYGLAVQYPVRAILDRGGRIKETYPVRVTITKCPKPPTP